MFALQTWAGATINAFYLFFWFNIHMSSSPSRGDHNGIFVSQVIRDMSEIGLVSHKYIIYICVFSCVIVQRLLLITFVPAAFVGARHILWLLATFCPNLIR